MWAPDEKRHQRCAANAYDDVGYFYRAVTSRRKAAEGLGAPRTVHRPPAGAPAGSLRPAEAKQAAG